MQVKVIRSNSKTGFCSAKFDNAEIIEDMAQKGYSFIGFIPAIVEGYGRISAVDLIFEKKEKVNE